MHRRASRSGSIIALALFAASPAAATTSEVSQNAFLVTVHRDLSMSRRQAYEAIVHVDRWWNPEHTWSGQSKNLSLRIEAGACFCERWNGNSVEHARVIYAARDHMLRLNGALGPLQGLAVNGVLTFDLTEKDGQRALNVTYRVAGTGADLREIAAPVDEVITGQVDRLVRYALTGKPD